jgi:uncharacterized protein (UPF0332 family)
VSEPELPWTELSKRALRSAQVLLDDGDPDGAASRAYYSMFYAVEALLLSKGLEFSKHRAVHAAFGREFATTGLLPAEFHRFLIAAYGDRLEADYESTARVSQEAAARHIRAAGELLAAAMAYLKIE